MLDIIIFITFDELNIKPYERIIAVLAISVFTLEWLKKKHRKNLVAQKKIKRM